MAKETKAKVKAKKETSQKIQYSRILEIDAEIAAGHYPNSTTLAEKLEVSPSSIKRDIEFMRYRLNAPIETYRDGYEGINGYYYAEETFRLPALYANEDEIMAGAIALKLLSKNNDTNLSRNIKKVFGNFDKALYNSKSKNRKLIETRIVIMEDDIVDEADNNFDILAEALTKDYFVTFEYKGHNEEDYIAPYQLLLKSGNWILVGYNESTDRVKFYDLNLIKSVEIIKEHFKMDENFTPYTSEDKI